ncbi:MAG: NAD-binding protein [bacterium]
MSELGSKNAVSNSLKHVKRAILTMVLLILGGSYGYWLIELRPRGLRYTDCLVDSLYFVIVTISTTGFGDEAPQTKAGEIFVSLLIIIGIVALAWAGGAVLGYFLEGHFSEEVKRREMKRKLESIADHYVLCGLGRVGMAVLEEFRRVHSPFVVIDSDRDVLQQFLGPDELYVVGASTDDAILKEAGIERAKGLVTCMPHDADNVFTVLSAKGMNPGLFIISRAEVEETRSKLVRAGADRVVLPSSLSGKRIGAMALRPVVVDFLDQTVSVSGEEEPLLIEEVTLAPSSTLTGKSLRQANIKTETEVMVLGVKSWGGRMTLNPSATLVLNEGDTLVGIGRDRDFQSLRSLAGCSDKTGYPT